MGSLRVSCPESLGNVTYHLGTRENCQSLLRDTRPGVNCVSSSFTGIAAEVISRLCTEYLRCAPGTDVASGNSGKQNRQVLGLRKLTT